MSSEKQDFPKIGITIGDINGVGPEVTMKALSDSRLLNYFTPVIYGSTKTLSYYRKNFRLNDFQYTQVRNAQEVIPQKVNVINCWEETFEIKAGTPSDTASKAARLALERAVEDIKNKEIDAIVTAPINKHNIQNENFKFPGHTEYLADAFNVKDSLMLMVSDNLRIGLVTGHIPLNEVSKKITPEVIKSKIEVLHDTLKNHFGIPKPKIAVMGINPHNGDKGLIGTEEIDFLDELILEIRKTNKLIFGPFPADGFFGGGNFTQYDAVLAMYHDQGLIPFKTLAFGNGINFTAGLPIIRTSPDHGTAYSIAGKDIANESSMRTAIYKAYDLTKINKS